MGRTRISERARFLWEMTAHVGDKCVRWPFRLSTDGYGYLYADGKYYGAHRILCIWMHGGPEGYKEAAHECGNRWCVNPAHISWKTKSENALDRRRHGMSSLGSGSARATLTEEQARQILNSRKPTREIAAEFNVSMRTVRRIKTGERWPHLRWSDEQRDAA